jgi:hypothetical protein
MELVDGMDKRGMTGMVMIERICWALLALIHFTPASMLFRPAAIGRMYHVDTAGPLAVLLHHRAALFVIVVIACLWAMADPGARRLAAIVVATSMLSFLILYWNAGSPTSLKTIARVDLAGLPFLSFVCWRAFAG